MENFRVECRFAPTALMFGNIVTGCSVLAPAWLTSRVERRTLLAIWGLGFASTNSMQQVRLVGAAPALASASVALNTSVLYIGQAVGSAIGGVLYARDLLYGAGYVAMGFVLLALMTVIMAKPRRVVTSAG
jgi:predicted MFS family arabinose efflux permease